jgi:hypothetical protein
MRVPLVPPGVTARVVLLRSLIFLLPCAALALALPTVPHVAVVVLVVASAAWWASAPDHPAGAVALVFVIGWWSIHDVLDWRVPLVAVLLLAAHVVATVSAYGPATLAVDPHLARLWLGRALLALVPMPVAYVAVRGLDPELAPLYAQALVGSVSMTAQWWLDTREPKKEVVAAHLVNLMWNGLTHLEADPELHDQH